MFSRRSGLVLVSLALAWQAQALVTRSAPAAPTQAEVDKVHKQLETVAEKLNGMLEQKDGSLKHAQVGPAMKLFTKELNSVLNATRPGKMPPAAAMEKLQAARHGLAGLMSELTSRQETLMREDNDQRESLLLGVLMTHQKAPMAEQMEILQDVDFSKLAVSQALLAKHDEKVALYVQAATFLDQHPKRKPAPMTVSNHSGTGAGTPLHEIQAMLEKRLGSLEHELTIREQLHKTRTEEFAAKLKNATKKDKHVVEILSKREARNFKKWAAMRQHDISAMKAAVEGVKKGDMKAVQRAREALLASLKAMQSQTGGFLYLIQLGHQMARKDCPYCAAQCVDKCHSEGKPYVQCLTDCADAGKGK